MPAHALRCRNCATEQALEAAADGLEAAILCPADLEPEKLLATAVHGATIYAVRGTYDDCSRCRSSSRSSSTGAS